MSQSPASLHRIRGSDEREIAAVDRCAVLYDLLASEVKLGDGHPKTWRIPIIIWMFPSLIGGYIPLNSSIKK